MIILSVAGARVRVRCHITNPPAYSLNRYVEYIMQKICSVDGCEKPRKTESRMCAMHCGRLYRYGRLNLIRRENGEGNINQAGYIDLHTDHRRVYAHVLVAERALGKRLPPGACVHHVNENKSDNSSSNLVICPSEAYHKLLHRRAKALDACGHADWKMCPYCGGYSPRDLMTSRGAHPVCARKAAREAYHNKKSQGARHV